MGIRMSSARQKGTAMDYRRKGRKEAFNLMRARASRTKNASAHPKDESGIKKAVKLSSVKDVLRLLPVPHALIGGHAVSILGHPRTTSDIDVLVSPSDLEDAVQALESQGGERGAVLSIGGVTVRMPSGEDVDIVSPGEPWVQDAVSGAASTPHGMVATRPWIVLMKMWASRGLQEDTDMVYMIKAMSPEERRETRRMFRRWLPSDIEDLDQMIGLAKYA